MILIEDIKKRIAELQKELERKKIQLKNMQIEEMIKKIATEYGINPQKAVEVAKRESGLNPNIKGYNKDRRKTVDRGLFQINNFWHNEITDEQAYNPEFATRFFCKMVKKNRANEWYGAQGIFWVKENGKVKLLSYT